ncbi:glycosyltransferase family 2 protein [Periconia macrospinosa]|uniref:Glycosyltransferase family 2 protein n=1 Tax=Periconia macrospinosa TaxID=97972 RepID=A0A2V1E631_9PLEO|nr:glycosyltransferase family 2 protein [Periconia macrospinosa]
MAIFTAGLPTVYFCVKGWIKSSSTVLFVSLFLLRYVRTVVNAVAAHIFYKPVPISSTPKYTNKDVTVIIVTTELLHDGIRGAIKSILWHEVPRIIIAVGGDKFKSQIPAFKLLFPQKSIVILQYNDKKTNVREQSALAISEVGTKLFVKQDDHSYWPENKNFLPSLMAPLEHDQIDAVGSILKTRHHHYPISFRGFWNFIGMAYLTTRKREFLASDCIDGGIGCLEGRFGVFRTSSFKTDAFLIPFLNEYHVEWFGHGKRIGPLNVDDDKFVTRYIRASGKSIKMQGGPDSIMETELGEWPRYWEQIMRWTRTGWRSNLKEVATQKKQWAKFPWSMYANLIYSFVKCSLVHDVSLFALLRSILDQRGALESYWVYALPLAVWIYGVRLSKGCFGAIASPKELVYLPGYLVWVYVVSLIRIYGLFTCGNTGWGTAETASTNKAHNSTEGVGKQETKKNADEDKE